MLAKQKRKEAERQRKEAEEIRLQMSKAVAAMESMQGQWDAAVESNAKEVGYLKTDAAQVAEARKQRAASLGNVRYQPK